MPKPTRRDLLAALAASGALESGLVDLDGFFGLHPALDPLAPLVEAGQLRAIHAVATPYRKRSHFDAQDLLEAGTAVPHRARDGWLARTLTHLQGTDAVAYGQTVPLLLRGADGVGTVSGADDRAEESLVASLMELYETDPLLGPALAEGLRSRDAADAALTEEDRRVSRRARGPRAGAAVGRLLGRLLAGPDGPRIAAAELGGWDTHAAQGTSAGGLANRLSGLADGLIALRDGLGPAWDSTAVLVVTEFGRTVAPNGTGGTDHGTASAALLLGGAVAAGATVADWPGLTQPDLFEGRDLRPTTDLRAIQAGVLRDHLGLDAAALADVFPGGPKPTPELITS
ncbi:MAG: DUF1501 domain-containing protein [Proteobacteria bacterium]|nr:DUF1501 domain-containing protein [Pseudomonadota bacterium]